MNLIGVNSIVKVESNNDRPVVLAGVRAAGLFILRFQSTENDCPAYDRPGRIIHPGAVGPAQESLGKV